MNSLELREQRSKLIADTTNWFNSKKNDPNANEAEVHEEFDRRMSEKDRLDKEIATLERSERLEAANAEMAASQGRKSSSRSASIAPAVITRAERNKAMRHWLGSGLGLRGLSYDGATISQCNEMGFALTDTTINVPLLNSQHLNNRSVNTGGSGANATFSTTSPDVVTEMKYYSPIIGLVNIQTTTDGNSFVIPKGTDASRVFSVMGQTSATGYVMSDPTLSKVTLGAYMYRGVVQVSFEQLQDSAYDIEGWINSRLAEGAARTMEQAIIAGSGSSEPTGMVTAALALNSNAAHYTLASGKKAFDSFTQLDLLAKKVDRAYRDRNMFIFHDSTFWDLRGIVDSTGRPLWDNNITLGQQGAPTNLRGYPYLVSNSIDASGSFSKNIALFANPREQVVRMVNNVQMTRLDQLYRANGLIGIECLFRFDTNYTGYNSSIAVAATPAS